MQKYTIHVHVHVTMQQKYAGTGGVTSLVHSQADGSVLYHIVEHLGGRVARREPRDFQLPVGRVANADVGGRRRLYYFKIKSFNI